MTGAEQLTKLLSEKLGKREIVRRALAMIDQRDDQNARQLASINRLLERWDKLKEFVSDGIDADLPHALPAVLTRMIEMEHGD